MTEILHITERAVWEAGRAAGEYRDVQPRDHAEAQEGFIHCSLPGQLRGVAERYYADADDLVVLVVDTDLLASPVRFERPAPGAEEYPHIYGPIPPAAVTAVIDVSRDETGRLVLPGSG